MLALILTRTAQRVGHPGARIRVSAATAAATNKLLMAAGLEFPDPGRWRVEVFTQGPVDEQPIAFDMEIADPATRWLDMGLWIAGPPVAVPGSHRSSGTRDCRP